MKVRVQNNRSRKTIPLDSIDLENRALVITFAPDLDALRESLARAGMIHPPLVQEAVADSRYRVVVGYKRILAARELGWNRLDVKLARPGEDELELFLHGLEENLGTRPLNLVEKALALDKLRHQFGLTEKEVLSSHLPRLGLGSDPGTLSLYLALAGLEEEILHGLAEGELSLSAAHRLAERAPEERLAYFRMVHRLKPGKNLQREFLDLLADIGRREKTPINSLLAEREIAFLIENKDLPAPQRSGRLRRALLRRRYPRFSEAMELYEQLRRQFRLPPGTSLSAPPYFEGRDWRLSVTFRNREELKRAHKTLGELIDHPLLERLINFPPDEEEES